MLHKTPQMRKERKSDWDEKQVTGSGHVRSVFSPDSQDCWPSQRKGVADPYHHYNLKRCLVMLAVSVMSRYIPEGRLSC